MAKTLNDFGIALKDSGVGKHYAPCPECANQREKKLAPCLAVEIASDELAYWECDNCGWAGSLHAGQNRAAGTSSRWNLNFYGDVAQNGLASALSSPNIKLPSERSLNEHAMKFFADRHISEATLIRNQIFVRKETWFPNMELRCDAIAFPYFAYGECMSCLYVSPSISGKREFRMDPRGVPIFYGLDDVINGTEDRVYIVGDEIEKLAMEEAEYRNVIALPTAGVGLARNFDRYFELIANSNFAISGKDKAARLIDSVKTFAIATDGSARGQLMEDQLVRRLGPERCQIVRWPKRADPKLSAPSALSTLADRDKLGIVTAINRAKAIPIDGVFTVNDFREEFFDYYENGLPPGLDLGSNAFRLQDGRPGYSLKTGTTTVLTGWDQSGKTRVWENWTVDAAVNHGWKFGIFSPEVLPLALLASYFAAQWAGEPFVSGNVPRMSRQKAEDAADFLAEHFFYLMFDEKPFSVEDLLERATKLVRDHGIKGFVIDPWNNVYHAQRQNEREDQYIGRAIQMINAWRRKYDVWVLIAAHPKLPEHFDITKQQKVVHYHQIKGGAEWGQMVDFAISVWRDVNNEQDPTQIWVQKVKFQHLATIGCARRNFDKPTARYFDIEGEYFGSRVNTKQVNSHERPHTPRPEDGYVRPWERTGGEWNTD